MSITEQRRAAYKKARAERRANDPDPSLACATTHQIRTARDMLGAERTRLSYLAGLVAATLSALEEGSPPPELPRRVPPILHRRAIPDLVLTDAGLSVLPAPPFDLVEILYRTGGSDLRAHDLRTAHDWLTAAGATVAAAHRRLTEETIARYHREPLLSLDLLVAALT